MKKSLASVLSVMLVMFCFGSCAKTKESAEPVATVISKENTKNGTILHCWCWSFKTIEASMDKIAASGFTAIQTSPINTCLVGDNGGMEIFGKDATGKWYYHYQPTDWKIGNYQLGTRDDFISMCRKADEYKIAVIVDVLPNHTTPDENKVSKDFYDAVGGKEKMYHKNGHKGMLSSSDRLQCTTYSAGSLPDVNTENPLFQKYFMAYMNNVIECGADGFRFDTAKHIGLPDDPKDEYAAQNNFWPVFTGKEAIDGIMLKDADKLFLYGEVLQDGHSREDAYGKYLSVVASDYGKMLRSAVKGRKFSAKGLKDFRNKAGKDKVVTWVESHDTYANQGESAKLTNFEIRAAWAFIASRQYGTPLFFNRPQGAEATQFPGASKIGDMGNDEFMNCEVAAVNKFRIAMAGQNEELINGDDASLIMIKRGGKGIVIINLNGDAECKINAGINLPDGTYKDKAHGLKFKVKDGVLTGTMPKETVAVVY
ncbi:MAG: alpha-amylase family glycosyl hydrolase [Treponema sp.]|nr:alpha-amylase family glycosyl hydrolase [Treponema sp.]